jgi:hypothetical protein
VIRDGRYKQHLIQLTDNQGGDLELEHEHKINIYLANTSTDWAAEPKRIRFIELNLQAFQDPRKLACAEEQTRTDDA